MFSYYCSWPGPPNIVSSAPNDKVIAGQSITLRCGHSHQNVSWYKEGSDVPLARGQKLTIHDASPKDEGTYYCATGHGPRGSLKVLVIGRLLKRLCVLNIRYCTVCSRYATSRWLPTTTNSRSITDTFGERESTPLSYLTELSNKLPDYEKEAESVDNFNKMQFLLSILQSETFKLFFIRTCAQNIGFWPFNLQCQLAHLLH